MSNLAHFPLPASSSATVMETIMKPLSYARRPARWLMAAGLALAAMHGPHAAAQPLELATGLNVEGGHPNPDEGETNPFLEKNGIQRDCDYVEYRLRFGARGDPAKFMDPAFTAELQGISLTFRDQMPAGLEIVDIEASGDGTDALGGPLPAGVIGTTTNPNDTATISDFRLSTTDLDGLGPVTERAIDIKITARIDHAAFPAPTIVDNQGFVTLTFPAGGTMEVPSHDPSLPDDLDFRTGDPTSVLIDVTGCEPPPPPPPPGGDEACFSVDTGTVDCVPGGGAYIYNMTVGADMAGNWVQVESTTPGITVAEGPQLVPPGGGVLSWTILGALPGDVVHLVVTGIETYAGPEEGVGLCCSQTVDVVIPEDLECPPEDKEPDIQVEKRADVARCTPEGGCDFTIRVTNVGDAPYNGPIVLDEVTTPGNAAVVSGPSGLWSCVPMVSPMSCTHPATTLNPGEFVELKLGFAPGAGWEANYIRNCAEYDYTASGKTEVFGSTTNDKACATIPICIPGRDRECTPPEEEKVDLGIRKSPRSVSCTAEGVCFWRIDIINTGTVTHSGPLTVVDSYPAGVPASSDFEPTPPWSCAPAGAGQFQCDLADITLVPGAFTTITVKTVVGGDFTRDEIENCAEVQAIPGETDLTNNKSCAKQRVPNRDPGQPALRILKTCDTGVVGAAVSCRITVTSVGSAAPVGPVRVDDAATVLGGGTPVQIQTVTPDGAEWTCGPVPADTLSCEIPGAVMTPGTSRHFDVTLNAPTFGRFENCARGTFGPAPGDDVVYPIGEACAQGGTTINVEKTGDAECRPGEPCTFEITITNDGSSGFSGPVRIGDAIAADGLGRLEGVEITSIEPPFGCSPEPTTLPISCVADLTLGAGESHVHRVTVVIPNDGRFANLNGPVDARNCVGVLSPDQPVARQGTAAGASVLDNKEGGVACHPFVIINEVENQCSEGFVLNDAGRCVCPEGTTFRNGQCVGGATTVPIPQPKPDRCTLLPGQIRTKDGQCVCPQGTDLRNGRCVGDTPPPPPPPPATKQCQLLPGQIRLNDGRCVCPRGTSLVRGACRKDEPPQCRLLPGQIRLQDGRCVCPRGTSLVRGACRKDEPPQCRLLPGQIRLKDGRCVCPRGTSLVRGACRKDEPPQCRLLPGQIRLKDGRCVCPRGTELRRGACRPVQVDCPRGTALRNGKCVSVQPRRCPRGTIGTPPNCRKLNLNNNQQNPQLQINPDLLRRLQQRQNKNNQLQ